MDPLNLGKERIHLIGVGGSGIFPVAQILSGLKYELSGSDIADGSTVQRARDLGVKVSIGHAAENIAGAELVIYSAAIPANNPELVAALQSKIEVMTRAEILGIITARYKRSVCIAGTHGKTTTTALLVQILLENNIDTSAIIGGVLPILNGSGRFGQSDICVCEACEYANTFLGLGSSVSVILNIGNDHLEFFGSMGNLILAFGQFCLQTKDLVIYNGDDANTREAVSRAPVRKISFGLGESNDYYAANIKRLSFQSIAFDLFKSAGKLASLTFNIPGEHNIYNVLASLVAAIELGLNPEQLTAPVFNFKGVNRRFEVLYKSEELTVVDDYAHHPTEIKATLTAARQSPRKNIWVVFQPFTYSRTKGLLDDFVDALSLADRCIITDIMGGREFDDLGVSSFDLAKKIPDAVQISSFDGIVQYIVENVPENTLLITLGCGDIYKAAGQLVERLRGGDS
ncbi:MAG: UDP-N-acetylmuramate--L-alanine ligase [Oscillospiraceae bacterium]|jgi:UDP-N-acetylmuramate--alanine ligase|nr:UDP-N-acetylmuramate--L-alanine ligase [Oscillospiraceae bacterium]